MENAKVELEFKSINDEVCWRIKSCKYHESDYGCEYDADTSSMWIRKNNQPICCNCLSDDIYEETEGIDWGGYVCLSCNHSCFDKGYCWFDFIEELGYDKILTLTEFELKPNYNYQEIELIEN
jgi:hypothetical protein